MRISDWSSDVCSSDLQSTNDLTQITPGLSQNRSIVGISAYLRGVGQNSAGYTTELPVATYLDGLYLPPAAAAAFSLNNIPRINVLKGTHCTLYGRKTPGGLLARKGKRLNSIPSCAT